MKSYPTITCLYLISTFGGGGAESQLLTFVGKVKQRGVVPVVCALKGGGVLEKKFMSLGIEIIILGGNNLLSHVLNIHRIIKSKKIDIIHAHMSYSDLVSRIVKVFTKVPIVVTQHGLGKWKKGIHIWVDKMTASTVDYFIMVSNASRNLRLRREKYSENKITVIPNGINGDFIIASNDANDKKDIYFGTVARLTDIKRIDILIEAFAKIKKEYSNLLLEIIGDGPNHDSLLSQVKMLGIEDSVKFWGWQEDIKQIVSKWDVFVLPSKSEDFPLSLLEAMGMGIAPIASNVGGIPDIIENGKSGILCEPENIESFIAAMKFYLKNSIMRNEIAKNAQKTIAEKYTIDYTIIKTIEIYKKVLQR